MCIAQAGAQVPVDDDDKLKKTSIVSEGIKAPLWLRLTAVLIFMALCVLSLGLAWTQQSWLYALGLTGLVSMGFWRPRLGAYLFVALASVDLLGNIDWGRFTIRSAQLVILAAALGAGYKLLTRGELQAQWRKIPRPWWFFVAFSLLAALHLFVGDIPNPVKGLAYLIWSLFTSLTVGLGLSWILAKREDLARALRVLVLSSLAVALFGLLQWGLSLTGFAAPLVTQWMHGLARINGLSFEPSYFAFAMSLALSLSLGSLLAKRPFLSPLWSALTAAVLVVAVALSSSRSGWIALILIALVLVLMLWPARAILRQRWRLFVIVPAGYLLALFLLFVVSPDQYGRMAQNGLNVHEQSSSAPRIEGVVEALKLAQEHWLWGVGIGQFGAASARQKGLELDAKHLDARVTFNLYAELLVENGVLGLLLVLAALLGLAYSLFRLWRRDDVDAELSSWAGILLMAALLHFAVMAQFNQTFFRSDIWHLLGLIVALVSMAHKEPQFVTE